ncbi:MAG: SemiSWEET transporter [Bacteroidota bacterium]
MNNVESWLGILAGFCTTVAILPQIWKVYKTKKVEDVSLPMFLTMLTGVGLWTVYGVMKDDLPIIIFNGIGFVLNSIQLLLIVRYRN